MIEAYPLYWPEGRPRKRSFERENARFDMSFARARDEVVRQVTMLAGRYPDPKLIISTNLALRRDGLPLASQRPPEDTGVAVYFDYKKKQVCFACDRWRKIEDNMQAIAKTIDALRGVARWGTGDMMEAAFKGFTALPSPGADTARGWRTVMGYAEGERPLLSDVEYRYRKLASAQHADRGGDHDAMVALNAARDQARRELGV